MVYRYYSLIKGLDAIGISRRYLEWTEDGDLGLYDFDLLKLKNLRASRFISMFDGLVKIVKKGVVRAERELKLLRMLSTNVPLSISVIQNF